MLSLEWFIPGSYFLPEELFLLREKNFEHLHGFGLYDKNQ